MEARLNEIKMFWHGDQWQRLGSEILYKSSAVAEMGDRATTDIGRKDGGLLCPFRAELVLRLIQCGLGRGLHGPKIWGLRPLFRGGGAVSSSNTKSAGPSPTSIPSGILIYAAIWPQQISAEKWGLCPFGRGGAGSPSNTMWPAPSPTCVPSFILIHQTVWPQYTNVTDRQTERIGQTNNGPIA